MAGIYSGREDGGLQLPRILTYTKEDVEKVIGRSQSYRDILIHLGLSPRSGSNSKRIQRKIKEWGIEFSHYVGNRSARQELSTFLVEGSVIRSTLKKRVLEEGLLKEECAICKQRPKWKGQKLVLILDHISGVFNDNRLENLRMLCPNCNAQQPTFGGRNIGIGTAAEKKRLLAGVSGRMTAKKKRKS